MIVVAGDEQAYRQRFVDDKVLGEGEFGLVKMVRDTVTTEFAACKVLRKGAVFKNKYVFGGDVRIPSTSIASSNVLLQHPLHSHETGDIAWRN
jgi:serine/threonine protein kinase